ncbi:MAG TPA: hypothetical protein PKA05_17815 [Roseiflexaceae bacterium]|nr:hypothetical protein [Roseiflexaceae bacterium]HMP42240.1 hypothetical protein [Roseiflexaceae bacterium]
MKTASPRPAWFEWVACYLIWLVICIFGGYTISLILPLLLEIALALEANQWVGRAVRQLALPVLGLIWLLLIFWSEHYLRTAIGHGLLWRRTIRILTTLITLLAIITAAGYLIGP